MIFAASVRVRIREAFATSVESRHRNRAIASLPHDRIATARSHRCSTVASLQHDR
jgi:hypothetical protein